MKDLALDGSESGASVHNNIEFLERGRSNLDDDTIQTQSHVEARSIMTHMNRVDSREDDLDFPDININHRH